jgi:hypothetical protein
MWDTSLLHSRTPKGDWSQLIVILLQQSRSQTLPNP